MYQCNAVQNLMSFRFRPRLWRAAAVRRSMHALVAMLSAWLGCGSVCVCCWFC
jgi:hypothetical protein